MRILHMIDGLRIGGAERQMVETATGLHAQEDMVCDAISMSDGPLQDRLQEAGCRVYLVPRRWRWDLGIVRDEVGVLNEGHYDLIHTWDGMSDIYAFLIKAVTGVTWVAGSGRTAEGLRTWREWLQRLSWLRADAVVANSKASLRAFRLDSSKGHVIYNGIDLKRFNQSNRSVSRQELGFDDTDFVIGMVANFTHYKDQGTLIHAAIKLLHKGMPLGVVLLGDGPRRTVCQDMAQESGFAKRFAFLGSQVHPERYIATFDVSVLTSAKTGESCSNALLECMAMGVPVVATNLGGNVEVVEDGRTGYLVPFGDPASVAERLFSLYRDPSGRLEMGERAAQVVQERFSREQMVENFAKLYSQLLSSRH